MRVLIADDHPLMVDGLRSLLEAHDIEVAGTAGDGQTAVAEALRLEPDLVLMDISMPVCDGLTAEWWVANRPKAPDAFAVELERALQILASQPQIGFTC